MTEQEGVIKYRLDFEPGPPPGEDLEHLKVCRAILHGLDMIGQHPDRYDGYGYGNLSQRTEDGLFVISASQSGHLETLEQRHFTQVLEADIAANRLRARGVLPPSSEALTHAMIYRLDPAIACVLHEHRLWRYGLNAGLPRTAATVAYGTPQMARAVEQGFRSGQLSGKRILFMAGHEDGVIAFGDSISSALGVLLHHWVASR